MRRPWSLLLLAAAAAASGDGIRRLQGVPDSRAFAGRLFSLAVPDDAFEGKVRAYEVTEAGEEGLPAWLQFDARSTTFRGVPAIPDCGNLYVCVKAIGEGGAVAKDVFSVDVSDEDPVSCPDGDTNAVVALDADLAAVRPEERLRLLEALARHLAVGEAALRMVAPGAEESSLGPEALRAGPGNALRRTAPGFQVRFSVGCAGDVSPQSEPVLTTLESSAANGQLSEWAGGLPVVGWHVTSAGAAERRERRNVGPMRGGAAVTPMPKLYITRWPVWTENFDDCDTTKGNLAFQEAVPEVRFVPTMSTPRLPTDSTHRHRHHHQDPLRREHHLPTTTEVVVSPTHFYSQHPFSHRVDQLSAGGTPMPTPVVVPGRPTRLVVVPTRVVYGVEDTASVVRPTHEEVLSRWYLRTTDFATVDIKPTRSSVLVEATRHLPQTPNFKPTVNNRLKKLSLVAGKAWSYVVPHDTFVDLEDGNTRDLKLIFMTADRTSLPSASWVQFDPENQVMYALPLSSNVGRHEFVVEAMDSEGASTFDRVELHVWQHPALALLTHAFTMTVRFSKWQYPVPADLQIELLNRVALLFGDPDNSKLSVLGVTLDPVKVTWANDSLLTDRCPLSEIRALYESLATEDRHPSRDMKKLMEPEFRIQDIGVTYRAACEGVVTTPPPPLNFSPRLRNPIRRINVTAGDVIKFKIPEDTFYDFEDGGTRHLALSLLTADNAPPSRGHWLQFDNRSQELYGLPAEADAGRHDLLLNAVDSDGHAVPDAFVVHVHKLTRRKKPPVEFSIHIDHDFDDFDADTAKKTLVANKLAKLYGDAGPHHIMVTNVSRGSVVYAWSNKTLGNDYCPKDRIDHLVRYLVVPDGGLTVGLVQIMEPEFRVTHAHAEPTGVCLGGVPPTFVTLTTTTPAPPPPPGPEPTLRTRTGDDVLVTTIVPAVVIALMLVIAALVAYFLYWRKRKGGKASALGEKDFIGSGVPVVFAGELEEQRPDPGKAPAIMKNEKPPLSTDYLLSPFRRNMAAVRDLAPPHGPPRPRIAAEVRGASREPQPLSRDRRELSATLYKPPPPPFASDREVNRGTRMPKSTQAYRHATYVPP